MIRSAVAVVGLIASTAVPATALAQSEEPTVSSYLCQFANRCDGAIEEASEETIEAPETKGFRAARAPVRAERSVASAPAQLTNSREQARNAGRARTPVAARAGTAPAAGTNANLVISFDLNSAQLTSEGRRNALVFAEALGSSELRSQRFLIAGHTDALGSREANAELSRRRAQAVADILVSRGIDRARLEVAGYGEESPLRGRSASDPANRRVEAVLR